MDKRKARDGIEKRKEWNNDEWIAERGIRREGNGERGRVIGTEEKEEKNKSKR